MAKQVLTVIFGRADLVKQRGHLGKGALFLPEPEPAPEPFAEIALRVEDTSGAGVELDARVLQILAGRGIAVSFDDLAAAKKKLAPLLDAADASDTPDDGAEDQPTFIFWGRGQGRTSKRPPRSKRSSRPSSAADRDLDAASASATEPPSGMDLGTMPHIPVARALRTDPAPPPNDTLPRVPVVPVAHSPSSEDAPPPSSRVPRIVKMTNPPIGFAVSKPPAAPAAATAPAPPAAMDTQLDAPVSEMELSETAKLQAEIAEMSVNQKMQLAMKGDRTARALLLKDPNKNIQSFIIQNPRITLDEVKYLAGFRQANADVLNAIAAHRDWTQNPGVVSALVRNPKTPGSTAVRMMEKLPMAEIRRLAKSNDSPPAVMAAARKKIADPGAHG